MKRHTILILTALLVLSAVGTAGAQGIEVDRRQPVTIETFGAPSRFDLAEPWGVIDEQDTFAIVLGTGKTPDVDVPRAWDINFDGVIDIVDVGMISSRYGCTAAAACYWWR